jgi:hypothetical protein
VRPRVTGRSFVIAAGTRRRRYLFAYLLGA